MTKMEYTEQCYTAVPSAFAAGSAPTTKMLKKIKRHANENNLEECPSNHGLLNDSINTCETITCKREDDSYRSNDFITIQLSRGGNHFCHPDMRTKEVNGFTQALETASSQHYKCRLDDTIFSA